MNRETLKGKLAEIKFKYRDDPEALNAEATLLICDFLSELGYPEEADLFQSCMYYA